MLASIRQSLELDVQSEELSWLFIFSPNESIIKKTSSKEIDKMIDLIHSKSKKYCSTKNTNFNADRELLEHSTQHSNLCYNALRL
jgi:predicted HAD superfamily hydrolase